MPHCAHDRTTTRSDLTARRRWRARYACLEAALVSSWRAGLGGAAFPAVAVQLPGYDGDCASLVRKYGPSWDFCGGGSLLQMRLAQESGMRAVAGVATGTGTGGGGGSGAVSATYDLSCPSCPFGSVHNTHKVSVGARLALQLRKLWFNDTMVVAEGPRVQSARRLVGGAGGGTSTRRLRLLFSGGSGPFAFKPTRNCTVCCENVGVDFDASAAGSSGAMDGHRWVNASSAMIIPGGGGGGGGGSDSDSDSGSDSASDSSGSDSGGSGGDGSTRTVVVVELEFPAAVSGTVRYTAAAVFPQCALYNAEGLPALPFTAPMS